MKTAAQIAHRLSPRVLANNAAIGETNRRLAKIGDGQGNPRPDNPLTPRDVYYRSSLDQNDRGVALLSTKCPITIDAIDGYYDTEVWVANAPGSSQAFIVDLADSGGQSTGGPSPLEGEIRAAGFPDQSRLVIMRIAPSASAGMAVFVDVGPYQIAYEVGDGTYGFLASTDVDVSDSTNAVTFNPTATALASGEHRLLGIALDGSTGKFFAIPGATQSTAETLPSAESRSEFVEDDYVAIDFTGYYPCGYVYNYFGQTSLVEDDCLRLFDPRLLLRRLTSTLITVRDSSGSPSYNDISTLEFSGGTVSNPSGGVARFASSGGGGGTVIPGTINGRLTLTSGTPITTSNVTAATTLYFTPYKGSQIALYDGSAWAYFTLTERSLSLSGLTASTPYDIFIYNNSGTLTLEALAWTNDTTRATALVLQDGVEVKSGSTTRLYLGTIRITVTTGQTEDSAKRRFVWNRYNQVQRPLEALVPGASFNVTGTSFGSANSNTTDGEGRVSFVAGLAEQLVNFEWQVMIYNNSANYTNIGVGLDSTSSNAASNSTPAQPGSNTGMISTRWQKVPAVGGHFLQKLVRVTGGTATFYINDNTLSGDIAKATGWIWG